MGTTIEHLINGKTVAGTGDRTADVYNPATGEIIRQVALASKSTTETAIAAAAAAYPAWRATQPSLRVQIMFRLKGLMEKNADKISALITEEHGKVLNDSAGELGRAIENIEFV